MEYPFRVKIFFDTEGKFSKLNTVLKINRWLSENCKIDAFQKWNLNQLADKEIRSYVGDSYRPKVFAGIEVGFKLNKDAVHFKLGFTSDGEKVDSSLLRDYREEEKGIQA